jgi:hypothetical protein
MPTDATDATISPETIARRRAAHEREMLAKRRWSRAVAGTSFSMLAIYLYLLYFVQVEEPHYLILNLLSIATGLCGVFVYRAYELPTILAELPRLSDRDRRINLAAIEPIRAELLARVLPGLGLAFKREEAAALDDDELVRRLAGLKRPNWRRRALICLAVWLVVTPTVLVWLATWRPEYGVSVLERL